MGGRLFPVLQLRKDPLCELLPELHTPLVEAEDIPDHPLNKNLVFIHGNETPQGPGSDFFDKDGVGWPIPLEDPVGQNLLDLFIPHSRLS